MMEFFQCSRLLPVVPKRICFHCNYFCVFGWTSEDIFCDFFFSGEKRRHLVIQGKTVGHGGHRGVSQQAALCILEKMTWTRGQWGCLMLLPHKKWKIFSLLQKIFSRAREWWRGFPETVRSEGGCLPQALHETRSASSPLVSHIYFCCHRRQAEGLPNVIDFVFQCLTRLTQGLPNVMISSMPGTAKRYDFLYRKRLAQRLLERGIAETATVETTECIFFQYLFFDAIFTSFGSSPAAWRIGMQTRPYG